MKKYYVLFIVCVFLTSLCTTVTPYAGAEDKIIATENTEIKILFLMDHEYGQNYLVIRPLIETYGWNITVAGTAEFLDPCMGHDTILEPDILISEIDDITEYDAITILPAPSHDIMRTDPTCLGIIQSAATEGLVVSAWCKAVRVLAAADVIDGKNITGHTAYIDEYETAGATFNEDVPPVIDGNIVTCVNSNEHRVAMCQSIAIALGVFEEVFPEISSISFSENDAPENSSLDITCVFTDVSGISYARAYFYRINETGGRDSAYSLDLVLDRQSEFTYTGKIEGLDDGSYSVDIYVKDRFVNIVTYTNATLLTLPFPSTDGTPLQIDPLILGSFAVGAIVVVVLVVVVSRKK